MTIRKNIEERASIIFYYPKLTLQLDMSFNSRFEERGLIIEGKKVSIKGDLLKNEITINKSDKIKTYYKKKQNNLNMLYKQMKFFINSVEKKQNKNNISRSLDVIRIISLIRKSNLFNRKIKI